MRRSFLSQRLLSAGAFFVFASPLVIAATLRVPEDFDRIQRAIHASASGDTIVIGPGTYYENLSIDDAITLRGAGIGKTIIMGRDRQSPVITADLAGPVIISDLTVSHAPRPRANEPVNATRALAFSYAPVTLRKIALKDLAYSGITSLENQIVMSDIVIGAAWGNGIELRYTLPGTRFDRITIERIQNGSVIEVANSAAAFRDLSVNFEPRQGIRVSGPDSAAKFENITPAVRARIEWDDRASADGPVPFEPNIVEKSWAEEREQGKEGRAQLKESRDLAKPARRKLARELQAALKSATTAEKAAVVVADYLTKLYAAVPPDDSDGMPIHLAITSELRAFQERFGGLALLAAIGKFPPRTPGEGPEGYTQVFTFDMSLAIERERAEQWVKSSIADLPQMLATWKTSTSTTPAATASAFLAMLKAVSAKSQGGTETVKDILRDAALAEFSVFIQKHDYAALDQLLRQISTAPTALVTAENLRTLLTPANTTQLVQFWKSEK